MREPAVCLDERQASHLAFFDLLISGRHASALRAAQAHLRSFPRDVVVLAPCTNTFGLFGFSGEAGREAALVKLLDWLAPAYGQDWWFLGQHAFALAETGQLECARSKIERSMAQQPRNAQGAHAVAHIYYEAGEQTAALDYLRGWLLNYPPGAQLHCHLSWHLALCELEAGNDDAVWRLFEECIHAEGVPPGPISAVPGAIALLWRSELAGRPRDTEAWRSVRDRAHQLFPHAGVAFIDAHIALADAITGDDEAFDARLAEINSLEREGRLPSGPVVPMVARGLPAFVRRDWSAVIQFLEPVMGQHERLGGSHAQRDLLELILQKAHANLGWPDQALGYLAGWSQRTVQHRMLCSAA